MLTSDHNTVLNGSEAPWGLLGTKRKMEAEEYEAEGNQSSSMDTVVPMDTGCSLPDEQDAQRKWMKTKKWGLIL